jgi:hypothetical protein
MARISVRCKIKNESAADDFAIKKQVLFICEYTSNRIGVDRRESIDQKAK